MSGGTALPSSCGMADVEVCEHRPVVDGHVHRTLEEPLMFRFGDLDPHRVETQPNWDGVAEVFPLSPVPVEHLVRRGRCYTLKLERVRYGRSAREKLIRGPLDSVGIDVRVARSAQDAHDALQSLFRLLKIRDGRHPGDDVVRGASRGIVCRPLGSCPLSSTKRMASPFATARTKSCAQPGEFGTPITAQSFWGHTGVAP